MTGLGEEVFTAPVAAGVDAMVEAAARAACRGNRDRCHRDGHSCAIGDACVWWMGNADNYRAALESLGVPMETLAELKAGTRKAVPADPTTEMLNAAGGFEVNCGCGEFFIFDPERSPGNRFSAFNMFINMVAAVKS